MTSISKTVNTDRLDDIVKEYNNTYYSLIKMEAGNVTPSAYFIFVVKNNYENLKFDVGHLNLKNFN